ncbi:tRNA (adenosine(37)-N6)-threonylcarbamoyltransferase complex dimerization subunit type 1 TsaB [Mucilaginibacter sp. dw_454]|uniref:tRNA (adenosine(37)-N6)-threonylcarbamoyltransferase complex dimerization subunit type 1 TsaB n=1 Tax=Mucilaginibacter sp. dw_454 TaxID=2720079 RepID=UPI001BD50C66|nr:tRNA (adenosine(37)-N6)-threonylcarbamoyltransferase complex dimerization subunit type 1 TsaB [Mucilaginibacter sp. dw_454]
MSIILQIETATTVCSVSLAKNGETIAVKQLNERNIHAGVITLFVEELVSSSGLTYAHIDAVAVSSGPGSYTGLRIGVSTAKGLCFALDKPLIAIETLESMAHGILAETCVAPDVLLCPMIDARRMEVYTALFDANGSVVKPTSAEIIDEHSFSEQLLAHKILFFGDGAEKCRSTLGDNPNAIFNTEFSNSATYLNNKALQKYAAAQFEDMAYFEPFYLKDFLVTQKKV